MSIQLEHLSEQLELNDDTPADSGSDQARSYRVTRERVRQIERGALAKLRSTGYLGALQDTDGYFQP